MCEMLLSPICIEGGFNSSLERAKIQQVWGPKVFPRKKEDTFSDDFLLKFGRNRKIL